MPFAIVIRGHMRGDAQQITPKQLHGAFFTLLTDPSLRQEAHDVEGRKAFALSPLLVERNGSAWFRVSFLEDRFYPSFSRYFLESSVPVPVVPLGAIDFQVSRVISSPGSWSGHATYEALADKAGAEEKLALEFKSPTTFRQGDLVLPLPVPHLAFQSYYQHWQQFSPVKFSTDLMEQVERGVGIAQHRLTSRPFFDGHGLIHGFVGQATFVLKGFGVELVRQLNALAEYAFYAGTGWKTTHGMGLTRRLNKKGQR